MKTDIKTIAEKAGVKLTSRGNIELGSNDQGSHGTPGSAASNEAVSFYFLADGDFRAAIDDRYGSNQGDIEWRGGDITKLNGIDLDEAISLAKAHIEALDDNGGIMRAWRIASSEARATMRKIKRAQSEASADCKTPHDALVAENARLAGIVRAIARLKTYGEGADDTKPDGDDAMQVLNWHISAAREVLAQEESK